MNKELKRKLAIREKRIKRANQIKELRASGMSLNQIAKKLRIPISTIRYHDKRDVLKPISRNTWKDGSVMFPTQKGWYWVCYVTEKGIEIPQIVECLSVIAGLGIGSITHWCGPISLPKYDPAEIELERKLREVTK